MKLSKQERALVILCFCLCMMGALLLPVDKCPDEKGRRFLSGWVIRTGTLPTGDELPTMLMSWVDESAPVLSIIPNSEEDGWGFSYALRPYLSSIIAALCQKTAGLFTDSPRILLAASRMCSVLAVTLCCFFSLLLGHRLFRNRSAAGLFAAMICFLPQVMFLGMYQNNDSLSLCAVIMILYFITEGYDQKWPVRTCIGLAFSFSLGLLSYYSIYGWLLLGLVFCVCIMLTDLEIRDKRKLAGKRMALITGLCLLLAGWFFLRNALLHEGDFLGIAYERQSRAKMREMGYTLHEYKCYRDEGMSVREFLSFADAYWLRMSARSFVGVFGYMDILMSSFGYTVYGAWFAVGLTLYIAAILRRRPCRRDQQIALLMFSASVLTVLLHFWQSYTRDFQPQGRYVITLIIPLAYLFSAGTDKLILPVFPSKEKKSDVMNPAVILTGTWLMMFAAVAVGTMSKMFTVWGFSALAKHPGLLGRTGKILFLMIYAAVNLLIVDRQRWKYFERFAVRQVSLGTLLIVLTLTGIVCVLAFALCRHRKQMSALLILMMLFCGATVNPIERGLGALTNHPISAAISEIAALEPEGSWLCLDSVFFLSNYPMSHGARVLDATNFYPDGGKWRIFDPQGEYEEFTNRYANESAELTLEQTRVELLNPDHIHLYLNSDSLKDLNIRYLLTPVDHTELLSAYGIHCERVAGQDGYNIYRIGSMNISRTPRIPEDDE